MAPKLPAFAVNDLDLLEAMLQHFFILPKIASSIQEAITELRQARTRLTVMEKLPAALKAAREFGDEHHRLWREAADVIHTMTYPEGAAELLDAVAEEISCGGNAIECEHCSVESDTNAMNCSREDRADDAIGCRWSAKDQLNNLAKALRARPALTAAPTTQDGKTVLTEIAAERKRQARKRPPELPLAADSMQVDQKPRSKG